MRLCCDFLASAGNIGPSLFMPVNFMLKITLPDGSVREFDAPLSVFDVAASIGAGLAKAALAGKVNGVLVDVSYLLKSDASLEIITSKSAEGVDVIRHSSAHLLAQAVKQLFPTAQVTIGPVIENGFFYDFAIDQAFSSEDLVNIDAKMRELIAQEIPVARREVSRDEAVQYFESLGEKYKAEIIRDIPATEVLSLYSQGDFTDLCRGPHVPNTKHLGSFKLTSVAGAYWRGDSKNAMLQRIYGVAFADDKSLKAYLTQLEEAEKRDHRKLGKQLHLFHMQEEAPGQVFWHESGWQLWRILESYIRDFQKSCGFSEIRTPLLADISLWQASGHADKYLSNMFLTSSENRDYALKPMNCPCHVQIFKQGVKSYRDLPVRYSEFGCCHRNESSGSLHGIMRVRGLTQDDGHIFCMESQVQEELETFIRHAFKAYADFGFTEIVVKLATRPAQRIGDDATWDRVEQALSEGLKASGVDFILAPGEGAFYGPKIELHLRDSIGRLWQCGTFQYDPYMPSRLGAVYVAEDNTRKTPVMLHRATVGSFERFIGILIEHFEGKFPAWLAPIQVVVMGISEKHQKYVESVTQDLQIDFRAKSDLRNEKIGFKIRDLTLLRIPFLLVAGDKEVETSTISVRTLSGEDLGVMSISAFKSYLKDLVDRKK
jgi:threonyl-tRNA synthetase